MAKHPLVVAGIVIVGVVISIVMIGLIRRAFTRLFKRKSTLNAPA
jgi:predicted tellurium resistance membrane protein TerC